MEKVKLMYMMVVAGIFICSCSQLLLKRSADKKHSSLLKTVLNWRVLISYSLFFCSLLINIMAMSNGVNLKDLPILESLGYVFVPLLSWLVLKEHISCITIASIILILVGIIIFYI